MKIKKHIVTVAAFCIAIWATIPTDSFGTPPRISFPIEWSIEPVSQIRVGEPIRYELVIKQGRHNRPASSVVISVSTIGALRFEGLRNLEVDLEDGVADTVFFEVILPANDTSGFLFDFQLKGELPLKLDAKRFFVTEGDSVEVHHSDVRLKLPKAKPTKYGSAKQGIPSTPLTEEEMRIARSGPNSVPERSTWSEMALRQGTTSITEQNVLSVEELQKDKYRKNIEEMHRKEQRVLLSAEVEKILIGDTVYTRQRGQREFRPAITSAEVDALIQKATDSLQALPDEALIELLVEAPDSAALTRLDAVTSNRTSTAIPGTYRVWIRKGEVNKIRELELRYELMMFRLNGPPDSSVSVGQVDDSTVGNFAPAGASTQVVIWSEDFDGSWPGELIANAVPNLKLE